MSRKQTPPYTRAEWLARGGSVDYWNRHAAMTPAGMRIGAGARVAKAAAKPPGRQPAKAAAKLTPQQCAALRARHRQNMAAVARRLR